MLKREWRLEVGRFRGQQTQRKPSSRGFYVQRGEATFHHPGWRDLLHDR